MLSHPNSSDLAIDANTLAKTDPNGQRIRHSAHFLTRASIRPVTKQSSLSTDDTNLTIAVSESGSGDSRSVDGCYGSMCATNSYNPDRFAGAITQPNDQRHHVRGEEIQLDRATRRSAQGPAQGTLASGHAAGSPARTHAAPGMAQAAAVSDSTLRSSDPPLDSVPLHARLGAVAQQLSASIAGGTFARCTFTERQQLHALTKAMARGIPSTANFTHDLDSAAHQLARSLSAGKFTGCTSQERIQLHLRALFLAEIAEQAQTLTGRPRPAAPPVPIEVMPEALRMQGGAA